QSTGVYWIPLYDILKEHGIEVFLVNAKYTKNLPGRKTDIQESQWLLKLHSYGLLSNSFRPPAQILAMRTYWRLRAEHVREVSTTILRMQKAARRLAAHRRWLCFRTPIPGRNRCRVPCSWTTWPPRSAASSSYRRPLSMPKPSGVCI